ncbi:glycosyltransferase family 2 protein [Geomesophilobacter sediminis]|uniref:Glycosyltransferase n=1 Tax=Geomesophilobacter sediminis TaxID=2798584 RepID=A0A8J7IQX7_9BACT|nr:glycosyltransferase family 2 protein [Geomesophilobacter sediminis]MBJ6725149.1 glycosyltransferase [Geomesophilobacter sediminis]
MPTAVTELLTALHFLALFTLCLYGGHRIWLIRSLLRYSAAEPVAPDPFPAAEAPLVTVQLPLYNERFVAERLLDAAAGLDWPRDRLQIQVLDDSTDDTRALVELRAAFWREQGVAIDVVRRENREGYKAGALARGMVLARGEFLAVFDADFIPPRHFLKQTIPWFRDPGVGMVQTRWSFCNADHSWFTSIQSLLLGPHFGIEHKVRYLRGLFFNFNGTAGVWRRSAIESAGGWQSDTVTEDLDLSYRAQLAGWRFVYRDECEVPSELPVTMAALRSQQQRWAKGSIQTARKILPRLLASPLPVAVKLEAVAHLTTNLYWLMGMVVMLTLYPAVTWRVGIGLHQMLRLDLPLFLATSGAIMGYFFFYAWRNRTVSLRHLLLLPVLTIGLAPSIALSVVKGIFRRGGEFERTPKFGVTGRQRVPGLAWLYHQKSVRYVIMNAALLCYCLLPVLFAWQRQTWFAIPLFLLFPFGFALVLAKDLREVVPMGSRG